MVDVGSERILLKVLGIGRRARAFWKERSRLSMAGGEAAWSLLDELLVAVLDDRSVLFVRPGAPPVGLRLPWACSVCLTPRIT